MARHKGHDFWAEQVRNWKQSGLSQRRFCQEASLALSTFHLWHRRIKEQEQATRIVAVPVENIPQPPRPLRLHVRGGYLLEIEPGFCERTLRKVLAVVGS